MKRIIRISIICFLLIIGGLFIFLEHRIGGVRAFVVTSASMEPAISTGSLIITQYIHPSILQKGDVITFLPPTNSKEFVTHRITNAVHQQNLSIFQTKGDNNTVVDPWSLAGGAIIGKVSLTIPYLGYPIIFIKSPIGIVLFILIPAAFIIINEILKIIRTVKHHKKKLSDSEKSTTLIGIVCLQLVILSVQAANARLSDTSALTGNSITVEIYHESDS